jgi:hypothetical protein
VLFDRCGERAPGYLTTFDLLRGTGELLLVGIAARGVFDIVLVPKLRVDQADRRLRLGFVSSDLR